MNRTNQHHDYYLDQLIRRLPVIGEKLTDVCWIMKDGMFFARDTKTQLKLCDLIMGYYNDDVACIELKGSRRKRTQAIKQLYNSKLFVEQHLRFRVARMKIAYYLGGQEYEYEELDYRRK